MGAHCMITHFVASQFSPSIWFESAIPCGHLISSADDEATFTRPSVFGVTGKSTSKRCLVYSNVVIVFF